ncbi:MAG: ATP-binding protein [Phormidesmis sp.]
MKHLRQLALTLPLAVAAAILPVAAQTLDIPAAQQRPPATLDGKYPYRPDCNQLIPQISKTNPNFTAWGPVRNGQHEIWYGLPTQMAIAQALNQLDAIGLCVLGGELVPWESMDGVASEGMAIADDRTPKEQAVERLKSAPDNADGSSSFGSFIFFGLLAVGALALYERFEDRPWMRRITGESSPALVFSGSPSPMARRPQPVPEDRILDRQLPGNIPDRISHDELLAAQPKAAPPQRTALEVLQASPFTSRSLYGGQRVGKTNLVVMVLRSLAERGVKIFTINLYSVGSEDDEYTKGFKSVRGDLLTMTDENEAIALVENALALAEEFIQYPGEAILLCDEWAGMTGSYGRYVDILTPLIKDLADKISGFSSSGMKRRKALWTIAPEIVAETMEKVGRSVKKLSLCLVAIAPGHVEYWEGEELTFNQELYSQVAKNYPGVLSAPPEDSEHSRIAFINGEWLPLGTKALVSANVRGDAPEAVKATHLDPERPAAAKSLSTDLQTFREWLDKKVGEVIDYNSFNNANCFRKISRSKESYIQLCDKAIMKGWLSQRSEETFFVFE